MKTAFLSVLLFALAAAPSFAQQRRLLSARGFTMEDGKYRPMEMLEDSVATEFTWLNPDSSITIELWKVKGSALIRHDEYRGKRPVGTWVQQYDPTKPVLKTVYDVEKDGAL